MSTPRTRAASLAPPDSLQIPQAPTRTEALCEGIIEGGWLLSLAVAPLFFNVYSQRTYEPDKAALLRSIALVMLASWLWKVLSGGRALPTASIPAARSATGLEPSWRRAFSAVQGIPLLPLVILVVVGVLVSAFCSVDPRLSWFGSYDRFQGAWTQLSYFVIFALALSHLRTRTQWRRITFTMIVTSVPVALYAVFQALGADPVPSMGGGRRAYSTLGNPIFLGAYLLMVFLVTAVELMRCVATTITERTFDSRRWASRGLASRRRVAALALILLSQLAALVLSESRGPFLGLLAGGYVFCHLGLLLMQRWSQKAGFPAPTLRPLLRRALLGVTGGGFLGLLFLLTFSLPDSPLTPLRRVPYLGRLGTVLDFQSNTARIRLLIWEGAVARLTSDRPVISANGSPDPLQRVRPWIGFGPETFSIAFNRFHPPELTRRQGQGYIADRAHNETFDALIMTGVLGCLSWLALFCAICFISLKRLGVVRSRSRAWTFWSAIAIGATLGAVAPIALTGQATLSGVGLPTGLTFGLVVFVTTSSFADRKAGADDFTPGHNEALILAILATVIAHVVEIHFGIAIVVTRLYFWMLLAVLVVAVQNGLGRDAPIRSRSGANKRGAAPQSTASLEGLLAGFVVAAVCAPLIYGLTLNLDRSQSTFQVLADAFSRTSPTANVVGSGTLFWLLVLVTAAAACLADRPRSDRGEPAGSSHWLSFTLASLAATGGYAILLANSLARRATLGLGTVDLYASADQAARHFVTFTGFMLLLTVATGFGLGFRWGDARPWSGHSTPLSLLLGAVLAVSTAWLIARANLNPISADTFLKQGRSLIEQERSSSALPLLEQAVVLGPREPMNFLFLGQAAVDAASRTEDSAHQVELLERALAALLRARELAPHDPDHTINLARYFTTRAEMTDERKTREGHYRRAEAEFATAIALRPGAVELISELALLHLSQGELDDAEAILRRALELDPRSVVTHLNLAAVHRFRAGRAQTSGDPRLFLVSVQTAVAEFERALLLAPENQTARGALAELDPLLDSVEHDAPDLERLRELYGGDSATHLGLAKRQLLRGRLDRALRHARLGLELAEDDKREAAATVLQDVLEAISSIDPGALNLSPDPAD